jgi:UDP-N-acetylmuramoyl-tripeptide--D-alanyl-D-alanine ligase
MFKIFKLLPPRVALYQLYLLQLEEYSILRYLKIIKKTGGFPYGSQRKGITWTKKLFLINLLAFVVQIAVAGGISWFLFDNINRPTAAPLFIFPIIFVIFYALTCYFYFLFLSVVTVIITPLDLYMKNRVISQAKEKIKKYPNLKVIGIAGSYGKTTMKEMLYAVISQKYKTLKTPKNINTPIGISRQILKELNDSTEYYIVEMGEYYKGDIKTLCSITKPDIAVVTGINEAHLERMGSIDTTIATIFELVENTKENGAVMLNADDENVMQNYQRYTGNRGCVFYGSQTQLEDTELNDIKFHDGENAGISFHMFQRGLDIGEFKVALLGEYVIADLMGTIQLAQQLGLSVSEISRGISSIKPVEHRLQPIYNKNTKILVIDDSYNGNPKGVEEAIKVLNRFQQNRRVYVTPGLVEAGERTKEIHINIGKQLASVAGIVILIRNSVTPFIVQGLEENGFDMKNVMWFDSAKEAHHALPKIVRAYDVILFQNDWPDNYL